MPRGLTEGQRAYARELFNALIDKLGTQDAVAKLLRIDQSRVSNIRTTGKTSLQVLLHAAYLAKRPPDEIAERTGLRSSMEVMTYNTKAVLQDLNDFDVRVESFLADLQHLPGFREWLRSRPDIRLLEAAKVIGTFYKLRPKCTADGVPEGGWDPFAIRVLEGIADQEDDSEESSSVRPPSG